MMLLNFYKEQFVLHCIQTDRCAHICLIAPDIWRADVLNKGCEDVKAAVGVGEHPSGNPQVVCSL